MKGPGGPGQSCRSAVSGWIRAARSAGRVDAEMATPQRVKREVLSQTPSHMEKPRPPHSGRPLDRSLDDKPPENQGPDSMPFLICAW